MVEMNEWGCGLYGGAGYLLTYVSFCDKNMGVRVICGVGYSLENTVYCGAANSNKTSTIYDIFMNFFFINPS